ncbi:MAG: histidine phosphatase family protein [Pseudomonadota bacterium]
MRRLILMRHAKSTWREIGLADHDRPLNKRGKRSASALGDWLRSKEHIPGEVLCSSSERTGQTFLGLALEPATQVKILKALYHADPQGMMDQLRNARANCVLMIGHNPGICDMAHRLVRNPPAHSRFEDYPTGATLVCDFDIAEWEKAEWFQGKVIDFVTPRELTD